MNHFATVKDDTYYVSNTTLVGEKSLMQTVLHKNSTCITSRTWLDKYKLLK